MSENNDNKDCKSSSNDCNNEDHKMSVSDFYKDQCIFMTGASGFLGKVILEKLLRDCPTISKIYVLLRSKQGVDKRRRIEEITKSSVFSRIRDSPSLAGSLSKIIPVSGDITFEGLGLSPNDCKELMEKVSIVFHVAATIRFDEPLRRAVEINVSGTKEVLELCKKLSNFKSLVHVSTAYCNRTMTGIKERVYNDVPDPNKIIDLSKWMDEEILNSVAVHLYNGRPSSYHYTKALAENLLLNDSNNMSIAIVRPSIITAAMREPMPGWIDNYNGPTGYFVSSGKGILRTVLVHKEKICDMIPVDFVANTCILSAVDVVKHNCGNVKVYNCTSGATNPIAWGRIKALADPLLIKNPSMELFRYPGSRFHANKTIHELNLLIEHTAVACIVDFVFRITGHKPLLTQVYAKVNRAIVALQYFTTNEWTFLNTNQMSLSKDFDAEEVRKFYCDPRQILWPDYLETYILGVRKFLLKEDPTTLPRARAKLRRLYYIMLCARMAVILGVSHQCWYYYPSIRSAINRFVPVAR